MKIEPDISGSSIVMVGDFNPAIFHPEWMFSHGVEDSVPDDQVNLDVCHRDVSRFLISDTAYYVDVDRFQIQTAVAPWVQIFDKASRVFGELLTHTPIRALGINRDIHFKVPTVETRTRIGRTLAPIGPWGAFGDEMEADDPSKVGGLVSLAMRSVSERDGYALTKNVKVEPSAQLKGNTGIYMQVNFHFMLTEPKAAEGSKRAMEVLRDEFEPTMSESEIIFNSIMELA
ncbi:hypothetical protein LAZ40_00735 [Cereibacter sphaeroides]|uniref:hypothetical protein n=1 Tax=Cereibacter sphaeroides TaxID=1063 RepID=UPI001F201336|nr:hypothetical protein [Cereibacter sphaeroides]MCE6957598.1 hypothetical protein [Cereibacter sphaeroides]MCE6971116.1 hypothetical protein [Cereibacter sphaeroides]